MTTNFNNLIPGRRYRITKTDTGSSFTGTFVQINPNEMLKFRDITIGNDGKFKREYDVQKRVIGNIEEVFTAGKMKRKKTRKTRKTKRINKKNLKSRKRRHYK